MVLQRNSASLTLSRPIKPATPSMRHVAELAGVSVSTVSRVVNERPYIASATTELVRNAMAQLKFAPAARHLIRTPKPGRSNRCSAGFLVFGSDGMQTGPAFHRLLRGVSEAVSDLNANLVFSFVSDANNLPRSIANGGIDGLLLHGKQPLEVAAQFRQFPTVWLMADHQRAHWGDQVLPNNPLVGEIAAKHLARQGHRHLACLKVENDGWSLRLRGWAFTQASAEAGLEAQLVQAPDFDARDQWCSIGLARVGERLVDQWLGLQPRPTGLFVLEDRLVPAIEAALASRGVRSGVGGDVEILCCNNERAHRIAGANRHAASLDVRPEMIGRRGVEHLLWRVAHRACADRVSILIEPELIEHMPR